MTLAPLSAAEEDLLCGRAAEVKTIVENCQAGRLTVIQSPAGFGASSLLRAGVEPALRRAGFITVVWSEWQGRTVSQRLRDAIVAAVEQADKGYAAPREPLAGLLKNAEARTGRPIAVLLDQFEDYLLCHSGTDVSDDFDAELSHAISSRAARFVIALHPGAVPELERLSQFVPNLLGYAFTLAPLDEESAREMVRRSGIDSGIMEEIVRMPIAAVEGGVNPSFVALAARGRGASAERIVLTSLDSAMEQLRGAHRNLLLKWIPALVSSDRHRLAVSQKTLLERSGGSATAVAELLRILIKAGLLRSLTTSLGVRYQLPQGWMAPVIHDWWTRTTARRAERRQTMFRAVSVLVGVIALVAAFLIYFAKS